MKKLERAKLQIRAVRIVTKARRDLSHLADKIDPEVPANDNFVRMVDEVLKAGWEFLKRMGVNPMSGEPWPDAAGDEWRRTLASVIKDEASEKGGPDEEGNPN